MERKTEAYTTGILRNQQGVLYRADADPILSPQSLLEIVSSALLHTSCNNKTPNKFIFKSLKKKIMIHFTQYEKLENLEVI